MSLLEKIAVAAHAQNDFYVRAWTMELLRSVDNLGEVERPCLGSSEELALAAAIIELLALRKGQKPPAWTSAVGGMRAPFYLFPDIDSLPWTKRWCEAESPEPLKRRNIFASPEYLTFA